MIQHFDLRDVVLSNQRITIRSARKADEEILLRWFDPQDAIGRCEFRIIDEFTIWPFIVLKDDEEAGFAQAWMTTLGTGGLEIFVAPQTRMASNHHRAAHGRYTDDGAGIACYTKAGFVDRGARRDDGDHAHIILEWP